MQPDLVTAFQIRMKGIQRILEGQMKGKQHDILIDNLKNSNQF